MKFDWIKFLHFEGMLIPLWETVYMVLIATVVSLIIGLPIGILLVVSEPKGVKPNNTLHKILDMILVNITRSIPFVILMVLLIPLSRLLVKKSYGSIAFIIPLALGAAHFVARIIEGALKEVDDGLIEASKAMGATNAEIIFKVMIKEAMPSIVSGITLSTISILGYTAMAGAVGAGGLGAVALTYGYQKFDTSVMLYTVLILIVIVQLIQCIGNLAYKKLK